MFKKKLYTQFLKFLKEKKLEENCEITEDTVSFIKEKQNHIYFISIIFYETFVEICMKMYVPTEDRLFLLETINEWNCEKTKEKFIYEEECLIAKTITWEENVEKLVKYIFSFMERMKPYFMKFENMEETSEENLEIIDV